MNADRASELRTLALRIRDDRWWTATDVKGLSDGVLELLTERDNGRRLAEDRFDSEMAELRDAFLSLTARTPNMAWGRQVESRLEQVEKLAGALQPLALEATILRQRVDGIAARLGTLEAETGPLEARTHPDY